MGMVGNLRSGPGYTEETQWMYQLLRATVQAVCKATAVPTRPRARL
jgi:hypothetical protein